MNPSSRRARQALKSALRSPEELAQAVGFRLIAGVDEAGRGPWAGPVVAAAVVLPARLGVSPACPSLILAGRGAEGKRKDLGVRIDDSKRLTPRQRRLAYHVIVQHAFVGIGIVPTEAIDANNILQATLQAMEQAVADLPCLPQLVLVDGNDSPKLPVPCQPIVNGDRLSYLIACASIVAKVTRDSLMVFYDRLFPAYQFDRHKGYGTSLHRAMLQQLGPSFLHRMSFRPVEMLLRKISYQGQSRQ